MKSDQLNHLIVDDVNEGFQRFVSQPTSATQNIGETLESLLMHYLSFAKWQSLPKIHIFHYADMSRNLRHTVLVLSETLGSRPVN
jgi:aryl sulfotransferase